jgi:hypothetical protein
MPYGNKMPKKMGCSGGGPHMYQVGSKEKNSPMNFSDKAMMYMKKMPAMYGKPKMEGDPVKKKTVGEAYNKLKEEGNIRSQGSAPKVDTQKAGVERAKKSYNDKFGEGAASKRKYDRSKAAAKKALGSNPTRAEVEAFKKKFPKMYGKKK